MHAIYPVEAFDEEAGFTPQGSRWSSGCDQNFFVSPTPAGLEWRHAAVRRPGEEARVVDRLADKPSVVSGLTSSQWLAQWCCLDEQA